MAQPTCVKPVPGAAGNRVSRVDWKRWSRTLATPAGLAWLGFFLSLVFLFCRLGVLQSEGSEQHLAVERHLVSGQRVYRHPDRRVFIVRLEIFHRAMLVSDLVLAGLFLALTQNVILATLFAGFIQIALIVGAFVLIRRAVRTTQPITQDVFLLAAGVNITLFVAIASRLVLSRSVSIFSSTNSRR